MHTEAKYPGDILDWMFDQDGASVEIEKISTGSVETAFQAMLNAHLDLNPI